jgi:hypothetical protein
MTIKEDLNLTIWDVNNGSKFCEKPLFKLGISTTNQ